MNMPMNFMRTEKVDHERKLNEEVALYTMLDHHLETTKRADEDARYKDRPKSLGAGRVGHPMAAAPWDRGCERALWFEMNRYPSEKPLPARIYRVFDFGHAAEASVADNLRRAGFTLLTADDRGNQFGFQLAIDPETGHARYKGFCDGVVVDGPQYLGGEKDGMRLMYPFLWENKAVKNDKWEKFKNEGLEKSHPLYYGQTLQYQNFLNLYQNPALVTMVNRDTGEIYPEFIRFNQRHCQAIIDRAGRVVQARDPLTLMRGAATFEKSPCKFCEYKGHCQKAEESRPQINNAQQGTPSWLSQSIRS